jgi:hypothetical protein
MHRHSFDCPGSKKIRTKRGVKVSINTLKVHKRALKVYKNSVKVQLLEAGFFFDHKNRAVFGFAIYPADIFPEDADTDQLHAAKA